MSKQPKTFEMEIPAHRLSNWAYERLHELLDGDLSNRERIEPEAIEEAQTVLKFKQAISERANFMLIRLRYEGEAVAQDDEVRLRTAMIEACDLLAERKRGNPARSAGHNARLCLEAALAQEESLTMRTDDIVAARIDKYTRDIARHGALSQPDEDSICRCGACVIDRGILSELRYIQMAARAANGTLTAGE